MEMWLRSQGSTKAQIDKHNEQAMKKITKWINQLLKIQDRQDLHYIVEADKKAMAMIDHKYMFRGSTEDRRSVMIKKNGMAREINTLVAHNFLGKRAMDNAWKKKSVTVIAGGSIV